MRTPTLRLERELLRDGATAVVGVDEVGRGALAGPVAVGATILAVPTRTAPKGLRDSKLLSEPRREELEPPVRAWVAASAVGLSTPAEIDEFGIIAALGFAARRALAELAGHVAWVGEPVVLLDGSHDWLTRVLPAPAHVRTRVKADRDCSIVAAASVIAKVHRDRMMIAHHADHPGYAWVSNKGYASAEHRAGLDLLGPTAHHRMTWLRSEVTPEPLFDLEAEAS